MIALSWVVCLLASALAAPAVVLLVECLAAAWPRHNSAPAAGIARPRLAVLVPAHDEAAVIGDTLNGLSRELAPGDRLIVIADNCSDETAAIARARGAIVLERIDAARRGKGFALDFGVRHLQADPPDVVAVVDADCQVEPGTLATLAITASRTMRPVQGRYEMPPPSQPRPSDVISSFAILLKNSVRPCGLARLGGPCLLFGSGMAFPWKLLEQVPFAGGHIVEDVQMAVDMALAGASPVFCDHACTSAPLPAQRSAAVSQRTRWEHGHLHTILTQPPRLLRRAIAQFDVRARGRARARCVPPLSLLTALAAIVWVAAATISLISGNPAPIAAASVAPLSIAIAVAAAWGLRGRRHYPLAILLAAPWYLAAKLPMYARFLVRRQKAWVRTERDLPKPA